MVYGLVSMVRDYGVGFPAPLILPDWGELDGRHKSKWVQVGRGRTREREEG